MLFCLEQTVKGCQTAETGFHCHLHDGQLRLNQQLLSFHQPPVNQIVITGYIHNLLEKTGEVEFAETCNAGNIIKLDILGAVFVDIITYTKEEIYVLQMFLVLQIGEFLVAVDAIATQDGEESDEQGINRGFPEGKG